jgi:hypothetical protein
MTKYLDQDGLKYYTKKIKDGTIVAGKCLASGIQGVIDISHIPQGALERLVQVADDTARFKLTTAQVQLGDTVKVQSTGRMYIVVDESKLSSAAGYMEYTAGQAAQVPWSGVTGKPTTLGGYGITDAAPKSHTHSIDNVTGLQNNLNGLGDRITALENFNEGASGGGLSEELMKQGHSVVVFDGFVDSATITQAGMQGDGRVVFVKSAKTFAFNPKSGSNYGNMYVNVWNDCLKYNPTDGQPYPDKLYLNSVDGRAYHWDGTNLVVVYQADLNKLATAYTFATTNHHQTSGFRKLTTDAHGMVTGSEAVTKNDITALGIPGAATNDSALSTAEIDAAVAQATA